MQPRSSADRFRSFLSELGQLATPALEAVVRLDFIDAPELVQPGGLEAKAFLEPLIGGRDVWITILTKTDTGRSVDRCGRLACVPHVRHDLADFVFTPTGYYRHHAHPFGQPLAAARNVELEMVLNDWAWVVEKYGPDDRCLEALDDACAQRCGIWAEDGNIPP
jgi:micrococcal nuclease